MTDEVDQPTATGTRTASREGWKRTGQDLLVWLRTLSSAAVYATLIVTFGFQVARVDGRSMEPTLEHQDRLVVNKLAYRLHDPQIGDVVMLLNPLNPDETLVKRIVAGPGESISITGGRVARNGVAVDEGFLPPGYRSSDTRAAERVPAGHYFVLGDHRTNNSDSRSFGVVPKKYILGKVQVRWWPIDRARVFAP